MECICVPVVPTDQIPIQDPIPNVIPDNVIAHDLQFQAQFLEDEEVSPIDDPRTPRNGKKGNDNKAKKVDSNNNGKMENSKRSKQEITDSNEEETIIEDKNQNSHTKEEDSTTTEEKKIDIIQKEKNYPNLEDRMNNTKINLPHAGTRK